MLLLVVGSFEILSLYHKYVSLDFSNAVVM